MTLASQSKAHPVMMYGPSVVLLSLICQCFVEKLSIYIRKKYGLEISLMIYLPGFGNVFLHLCEGLGFKVSSLLVLWELLVLCNVFDHICPPPPPLSRFTPPYLPIELCPLFFKQNKTNPLKTNLFCSNILVYVVFHWRMVNLTGDVLLENCLFLSQYLTIAICFPTGGGVVCSPYLSMLGVSLAWSGTGLVHAVTISVNWQCSCSAVSWDVSLWSSLSSGSLFCNDPWALGCLCVCVKFINSH